MPFYFSPTLWIYLGLPFDIIYESILRLSVITLFWYLFECFLKAKLFYSHSNERQGPDMQDICNQWNMTGMISVKSYSVFWNYTFCKLWHSFSFNPHSIHILIKDKVQTCKKSIINGIWLALFQLNRTQAAFWIHTFCKLRH